MERQLIKDFEADMAALPDLSDPDKAAAADALARLPLQIRGFGPVKASNAEAAAKRRAELKQVIAATPQAQSQAAQ